MIVEVELDFQAPEIRTAGPTIEYNVRKASFQRSDGYTFAATETSVIVGHDDSEFTLEIPFSAVRFIKRTLGLSPRAARLKAEAAKVAEEAAAGPMNGLATQGQPPPKPSILKR